MNIGELELGFKLNESELKNAKKKLEDELADGGDKGSKQAVQSIDKNLKSLNGTFSALKSAFVGMFAFSAITGAIKGIFNLTAQAESARTSFITLTGSVENAEKQLAMIDQFAQRTPFDKMGIIDASKLMMGMGFEAKQTLPILNAVGNAVGAMGGNTDTMNGIVLALGQMQTKGKVVTQELLQMAERGLPVFEILGEKLGLTGEQLGDIGNQAISASVAIPALLE